MSSGILLDIGFFLFYRIFHALEGYSILNIGNKQICLFVSSISGYQAKIALYVNVSLKSSIMNSSKPRKILYISMVLIAYLAIIPATFASRAVPDDLIVHPVLVTLVEGSSSTGSGFYFRHVEKGVYFISACHVFMEKDKNNNMVTRSKKAILLSYPKNLDWSQPAKMEINLDVLMENKLIQFNSEDDTFAIQISKQVISDDDDARKMEINDGIQPISKGRILTVPERNTKKYDEVLIGNDVFISGFPSSIGIKQIPQIDYYKPLLRKGIVAGKYDKLKTIIIDCATFGGNSGGPVIEIEIVDVLKQNVRVIGMISQFVPFVEEWINPQHRLKNIEFENSGYSVVVPIDKVIELIEKF